MEIKCDLDKIMKQQGRTQKWLSQQVDVSMATISILKQGKRPPTLLVALRIASTLGVSVEDIWYLVSNDSEGGCE